MLKQSIAYLDGVAFPINPEKIFLHTPTRSERFRLTELGDVDILFGMGLMKIELAGILPSESFTQTPQPFSSPENWIELWRQIIEEKRPVRFIYIGQNWEINMLCSIQSPVFQEFGGCFDVEYRMELFEWKPIQMSLDEQSKTLDLGGKKRDTSANQPKPSIEYTIKQNDTLAHIAKCVLGDESRWREIYALNKDRISDPNLIYVGQTIRLPEDASGEVTKRSSSSSSTKKKSTSNSKPTYNGNTSASNQNNSSDTKKPSPTHNTPLNTAQDIFDYYKNQYS